jgi:hypothetical protein
MSIKWNFRKNTMRIEVSWDNDEKVVLLFTYSKYWDWDEIYYAENAGNELVETVPHNVAVIHDMRHIYRLPSNALAHLQMLMLNMHPRMKYIIFVGMRPLVRVIWNTFAELYAMVMRERKIIFVETLEEARAAVYGMAGTPTR